MNAITIGPLMITADILSVVLGMLAFFTITDFLSRRMVPPFARWSSWAVIVFFAGGRLGHVLQHVTSFADEPWRIFAVYEGGFSWVAAYAALGVLSVAVLRKPRIIAWSLLPIAAGSLVAATVTFLAGAPSALALPEKPYPFLDGRQASPTEFEGQPLVINLWASWCPPCRREMPMMADAAKSAGTVKFLFVNQGESAQPIADFLTKAGISLDNLMLDQSLDFQRHFNVPGLPATLFVDRHGIVRRTHLGEISREVLGEEIDALQRSE